MTSFQPNWASKPGNTMLSVLRLKKISTESFAQQMHLSVEQIQHLIDGETAIGYDMATQLSKLLGASEEFWLNRQFQYQESIVRIAKISKDKWLKEISYQEMLNWNWINDSKDKIEACLSFFNIKTLNEWNEMYVQRIANNVSFRTSSTFKSQVGPLACWLRQGEIIGGSMECDEWNPEKFEKSLEMIKQLTKEKDPRKFLPKLRLICANSGVAIAIVRTPKGCCASGATKWLSNGRPIIILSFKYLSDDHFWFTLFHEVGHILLHGNKGIFLEGVDNSSNLFEFDFNSRNQEAEANAFAGEILIPNYLRQRLSKLRGNSREIIGLAMEAGVSAGIVVGQMQHYGYIKRNYLNSFKRRYNWNDIMLT